MSTATATATATTTENPYVEGDVVFSVRGRPHSKWQYYAVGKYVARKRADGKLTWRCVCSFDDARGRSMQSAQRNFLAMYGEIYGHPAFHWDIRHGSPAV